MEDPRIYLSGKLARVYECLIGSKIEEAVSIMVGARTGLSAHERTRGKTKNYLEAEKKFDEELEKLRGVSEEFRRVGYLGEPPE